MRMKLPVSMVLVFMEWRALGRTNIFHKVTVTSEKGAPTRGLSEPVIKSRDVTKAGDRVNGEAIAYILS